MLHTICQGAAFVSATLAAALWAMAARAKVEAGEPGAFRIETSSDGSAKFSYDGLDLRATLEKQGKWNSYAAAVTAVSVALQAASLYIAF